MADTNRTQFQLEDPLSYLPISAITEFRKGQVIYEPGQRAPQLFLVMEGTVKISRIMEDSEIVINLCQPDDFFGEPFFLGNETAERAVALEAAKVMSWPIEAVQDLIVKHPQLGIALVQLLAQRSRDLGERIGTLSVDYTSRRLAKTIVQLAERMGQPEQGQPHVLHMAPLPHKLLAQYIGTTREAVTHCMNQFRRQGFVTYSRRGMVVWQDSIKQWLGQGKQQPATPLQQLPPDSPENPSLDTLSA